MTQTTDEEDDPVDVSLETCDGGHYQMPTVSRQSIEQALAKALEDRVTFSMTNLHGGALVVPWSSIVAVYSISIYAPNEVSWDLLWQKPAEQESISK